MISITVIRADVQWPNNRAAIEYIAWFQREAYGTMMRFDPMNN